MRKHRLLAVLLSVCLAGCLCACGSDADSASSTADPNGESSLSDDGDTSGGDSKTDSAPDTDSSDGDDSETDSDTDSASDSASGDESSRGDTSGNADDSAAAPVQDNPQGSDSSTGGSPADSRPANNSSKTDSTGGGNRPAVTTAPPAQIPQTITETTDPADVVKLKTITLGKTITAQGEGINVRGSRVGITKGGTYRISGTLSDGQIEVNTEKKVVLQLAGASITNTNGAAINVINAKRVTIDLAAGTVNSLADGGTHDADKGAFFSNDTVVIQGTGTLNIKANYAHGITSDDDIIVNGGLLNITSTKSGLFANDCIEINSGILYCNAGTNGVKCKGDIQITGGVSTLIGGTKEEKGAIISLGTFTLTGGTLYAIGNTFTTPAASSTGAAVVLDYKTTQHANTLTHIVRTGQDAITITSPRDYSMVLCAGDAIASGVAYTVFSGGSISGGSARNYVTIGGGYSGGTNRGKFTTQGHITTVSL